MPTRRADETARPPALLIAIDHAKELFAAEIEAEDGDFLVWRDRTAKTRAAYEANERGLLIGRELDIASGWPESRYGADIDAGARTFIEASLAG
ncbi:MAG: hypothetical protein NW215_00395 [Hyphomicrobiales bacterium]|nr:hypothetical protein [Hyphomicrobiales bacterium]